MREFGDWMNKSHKEIQDGYTADEERMKIETRMESLASMIEEMNNQVPLTRTVDPSLLSEYSRYTCASFYAANIIDEEMYNSYNLGGYPYED